MKFGVISFVILSAFLTACQDSKKTLKSEDVSRPVEIEPGAYKAQVACVNNEAKADMSHVEMEYSFNPNGSYTEHVHVRSSDCEPDCELTVRGTYRATETSFTFHQKSVVSKSGKTSSEAVSKSFKVVAYVKERKEIILKDNKSDNICNGPLVFFFTKK